MSDNAPREFSRRVDVEVFKDEQLSRIIFAFGGAS